MRVFRGMLFCAGLVCLLTASKATAAPMLLGDCDEVLGRENSSCSLYGVTGIEELNTLDLTFASDTNVALFQFSTTGAATLDAEATPTTELFPFLGLFSGDTKALYSYTDPVDGELQAQGYSLQGVSLVADSVYYLAVVLYPNGFGGTQTDQTSLLAPFACEGILNDCTGVSANVRLSLQAISDEQPVPEPGTLVLLGTGLLATVVRRRTKKRS